VNRVTTPRAAARPLVLAAVAVAVALFVPGTAAAHDLKADVKPLADMVRVEAGYDDGTPAEGARVTVKDDTGTIVAEGVLDERGVWSFPKPGPGSYRVVVESAGHGDEVKLTVHESEPPAVFSRLRLDKTLGLVIGLALTLGGTLAFVLLRRGKSGRATDLAP